MMQASRLKVGVDVPWVTSWSSEAIRGAGPCPSVDGRLAILQAESPGYGRPNYSQNHVRRQRVMARAMLCPMCGQPTREGDRWMQTATRVAAGTLRCTGLGGIVPDGVADEQVIFNAGSIAPSHRACAERALEHCPHLGGMASRELLAFPGQWALHPLMVEAEPIPGAALMAKPPPRPPPAVMFLQLVGVTQERQADWRSTA